MRSGPASPIALIVLAIAGLADTALASETFLCADNTVVQVTNQNRSQMYDHPCVKAWFEQRANGRTKRDRPANATPGSAALTPANAAAMLPGTTAVAHPGVPSSESEAASDTATGARIGGRITKVRAGRRR